MATYGLRMIAMAMASKYSPSMKNEFPKESLTHEANLVVERDRAGVVGAHREFDSGKPLPEGGVQRRVEQPKADSAPAPLRHNPHPD